MPTPAARRAQLAALPLRRRLAFTLLTTLLALGALELGATLVDVQGPRWVSASQRAELMVSHPTRLWALAPGQHRTERQSAAINTLGLRGPSPTLPRSPQAQRALLLGDSTFFGHGVADAATMGAEAERALRADGLSIDVINASVPGYSSEQGRRLLDEQGWALEPTLLLVGYLWSDNNVDGFKDADLMATRALTDGAWLGRSRTYLLLATALSRLRDRPGPRIVSWTATSAFPDHGQRRVPLQRYAQNLDAMARAAASRGVAVAFVAPANRNMLTEPAVTEVGWGPYFTAQAAVAAHHRIPVIRLQPALQALYDSTNIDAVFIDFMHPTAAGHAAAGQALAAGLRAAGWPATHLQAQGALFEPSGLVDGSPPGAALPVDHQSLQVQLFGGSGAPDPSIERPRSGGPVSAPTRRD